VKKNVAIYLVGVNSLSGGGGAERFFADFFELYSKYDDSKYNIYFFTDQKSIYELNNVNKLLFRNCKLIKLRVFNNRFKKYLENIDMFFKIKKHSISIVHCANYNRFDFNRMIFLKQNPFIKVKLVQNIVDCKIPYILEDKINSDYESYYERYVKHLKLINFDGVFSWYKAYVEYFKKIDLTDTKIIFKNIESRFANTDKFQPSKEKNKIIVFASRFDDQKKPNWFIEAVNILFNNQKFKNSDWKFEMYGDGPLKKHLIKLIDKYALSDIITLKSYGRLEKVFPHTSCYVSTQDYENFPSLSMMEAMASGNIIVARDVGQTDLMVKDNINGFLLKKDSPEGLSDVLRQVVSIHEQALEEMMNESIKLVKEVHNKQNFFSQIEDFWDNLTMTK
tara:strand:+ start:5471 stop:6646 length:1176 start_codon:yes stop_codon:yes gene_type:complete